VDDERKGGAQYAEKQERLLNIRAGEAIKPIVTEYFDVHCDLDAVRELFEVLASLHTPVAGVALTPME
jgi:hypothetical protein